MTVNIPEGDDWECAVCGKSGDSLEDDLLEHYLNKHPDYNGLSIPEPTRFDTKSAPPSGADE